MGAAVDGLGAYFDAHAQLMHAGGSIDYNAGGSIDYKAGGSIDYISYLADELVLVGPLGLPQNGPR